MFFSLLILWIICNQISSLQIGTIKYLSIGTNSTMRQSLDINCTDCLCNCLNPSSSSCSGINCFPSNHSCQLIEQRSWILESDISTDKTSNNFIMMKANTSRFCSCYTTKNLLDAYSQMNSTIYTDLGDVRSIKYIPDDDSLIVLNSYSIRKLSAKNLSLILRYLTATNDYPISILHNESVIYIAFAGNQSINMFDLNLTFLQTSTRWNSQAGLFGGMILWNNRILIVDVFLSVIWSIERLTSNNLTKFFDFSSSDIRDPVSLFIYQNQSLYISSRSDKLYLFNLTNFIRKQNISISVNVSMLFMRYDSNCNRLWFGTQNYTYAPVLDLALNQMTTYQSKGVMSTSGIFSIDFNSNYTAFYADTNGSLHQIYLPNINC